MKKLIPFLLFLLPAVGFSQNDFKVELVIDEFTKDSSIVTSWMTLNVPTWKGYTGYVRFSSKKISDQRLFWLELKSGTQKVVAVDEGKEFFLKFEDESIMKLANAIHTIADTGKGAIGFYGSAAMGVHLFFPISKTDLEKLGKTPILKCRLTTNEGYIEIDPEKKKNTANIQLGANKFFNFMKNK